MANLKNIVDLPMAESAEGLNLIVNDNGAAKQIAASEVGTSSWNDLKDKPFYSETDEDGNETVHKLDAKYLPDSGSGGSYDAMFSRDGYNGTVILEGKTYAEIYNKFINKKFISGAFCRYIEEQMSFEISTGVRLDHMFDQDCVVFSFNNPYELLICSDNSIVYNSLD